MEKRILSLFRTAGGSPLCFSPASESRGVPTGGIGIGFNMNRSTAFTSGVELLRADLNPKLHCANPKLNIQVARIYENRIDSRLKKSGSIEEEEMDCGDSAEVSMENFTKIRALVSPLMVSIQVLAHPNAAGARELQEGSFYELSNYQLLGRDEFSPNEMVYVAQNFSQFCPVETMIRQSADLVGRVLQSRSTPDGGLECVTLVDQFGDELKISFKDNGKTRDVVLSKESVLGFKDLYLKRSQCDQSWQVVFGPSSSMLVDLSSAPHLIEEFERISSALIDWDMPDHSEPSAHFPSQREREHKRKLPSEDHLKLKKIRL